MAQNSALTTAGGRPGAVATASGPVRDGGRGEAPALAGQRLYRQITRRKQLVLVGFVLALLACIVADVTLGPSGLTYWDVLATIVAPGSADVARRAIVWDVRLPMAMMAVVVGASLAIAGAEMQTILNNPLASPFTLGISAAAGFGAAVALVLGVSLIPVGGIVFVAGNAFVCAMLASLLIYAAACCGASRPRRWCCSGSRSSSCSTRC